MSLSSDANKFTALKRREKKTNEEGVNFTAQLLLSIQLWLNKLDPDDIEKFRDATPDEIVDYWVPKLYGKEVTK